MKFEQGDVIKTKSGQHEHYVEETKIDSSWSTPTLFARVSSGADGEERWISEHQVTSVRSSAIKQN